MAYDHRSIETAWHERWEDEGLHRSTVDWDRLADSWLSGAEQGVVHLARGCAALERAGGCSERLADVVVDVVTRVVSGDREPPSPFENVTNAPGTSQRYPCWSPDGSQIACFDTGWRAVLDVPTGVVTPLSLYEANSNRATWTSDGNYLVYRAGSSGRTDRDLSIIPADGSADPVNYTATKNRVEGSPAWNPAWDPSGPGSF